ncbi:LacI family DNA-binding transcriptional regulator [Solicola sp. PLA-1-18]|uniref:LacI family DNA-binding transcriptional regulator n=1 Tax=Solicola sp. PLA-1-18 TaxID=3380532 RepID=UPI003B7BEFFE
MRRNGHAASVKDVAAAAGVSLGTVSNVLNRPDRVSDATRERVEGAMADLGFVRNETARQLRAGSSRTLAYVMLDAGNPFFTDVAAAMGDAAEAADLSLFLCNTSNDPQREAAYLGRLEQQRVQGVMVTPVDPAHPLISELPRRGTPVVIVDRTREAETHCSVAVDDVLGGELAAQHLLDAGHRRIGFVGGPAVLGQVRDRIAGVRRAVDRAGLSPSAVHEVVTAALTVDEGRLALDRIAAVPRAERPTAVVCANDLLALGLLQRCAGLGVDVPSDLAIVGYDDIDFAAAAVVPLTSVRQPRHLIGSTAAALVIDEADNDDHRHEHVQLLPELVVRASTGQTMTT